MMNRAERRAMQSKRNYAKGSPKRNVQVLQATEKPKAGEMTLTVKGICNRRVGIRADTNGVK